MVLARGDARSQTCRAVPASRPRPDTRLAVTSREVGISHVPWLWKVRCVVAWSFRVLGVAFHFALWLVLLRAYQRDPDTFQQVFSPGLGYVNK